MPRRRAALLGWLLSPLSSGFLAPPAAGHGARGRRASATKAELEVAQAAVDAAVEAAVEADARGAAADLAAVVLTPGAVVVRVDKAPSNSRRIFTGVDVAADIEIVWNLLTDYANLAAVVPNLVANEVLPGLNFRASMILDVDELRGGLPAKRIRGGAAALEREDAALRDAEKELPLKRGMFPRPWSTRASETTHDITMVSVAGEPGDFTLYQGLWRMEAVPLPGHAAATRLTFSVEIQPRPWLPVALVESRIADDLVKNLAAVAAEAKRRSDAENAAGKPRAAAAPAGAQAGAPRGVASGAAPAPARAAAPLALLVRPEQQMERARSDLNAALSAIASELPGGLGASAVEILRVRKAAERLGDLAARLASGPRGRADRRFDANAQAGRWRVAFSSAIARAIVAETAAEAAAAAPGDGAAVVRLADAAPPPVSELSVVGAFFRAFPRMTTLASRFALKSVEFEVVPAAAGDRYDTILTLRGRAQPFPAPALRLEHALIASANADATMICERIRIEPASKDRFRQLPRPVLPTSWLPPASRRRVTSFDVLYVDEDLMVTLSTDGDLRVARRLTNPRR